MSKPVELLVYVPDPHGLHGDDFRGPSVDEVVEWLADKLRDKGKARGGVGVWWCNFHGTTGIPGMMECEHGAPDVCRMFEVAVVKLRGGG